MALWFYKVTDWLSEIWRQIWDTKGRIIKANLSWSRTRAKFCPLIASLSVTVLQLKMAKLKLEVHKSDFQPKYESYEHR